MRPLPLLPLCLASVLVVSHSSGREALATSQRGAFLPATADQPVRVTDEGPEVTLLGAKPSVAVVRGGRLEYPDALGPGVDLVREGHGSLAALGPTARDAGFVSLGHDTSGLEDWIRFPRPPAEPRVRYRVALGDFAGLRVVDRTLELLDAEGAPRVRMHPPWIRDAGGKVWPVRFTLLDCAADVDPRPPWGRPVTAPGRSACTIELAWSLPNEGYPALLDPEWSRASDMSVGRSLHSATRLSDGRVLLVGGYSEAVQTDLTSAELFDPRTRTFATTGPLAMARRAHVATLLDDGRVVVLGGDRGTGTPTVLSEVERYDVLTGQFSTLSPLSRPRSHHTASKLRDGRILVAGSVDYAANGLSSAAAEICGNDGDACRATNPMNEPRADHAATPLPDGRVLISGGGGSVFNNEASLYATTTIFDPSNASWSAGPPMPSARFNHVALALPGGTTLIVGGSLAPQGERTTDEVLALGPSETRFKLVGRLGLPRWLHAATVLQSGRVLVVGTSAPFYQQSTVAAHEVYDVASQTASFLPALEPLLWHSQTLLADGTVLLAGGGGMAQRRAHIYEPPTPPAPPSSTPSATTPTPAPSAPPADAGPGLPGAPVRDPETTGLYSCAARPSSRSGEGGGTGAVSQVLGFVAVLSVLRARRKNRRP